MMTLLRFGWREMLRARGRAALIAIILAIQASALGGGFIAYDSLFFTRDAYYAQLKLADLDVRFVPVTPDEMPTVEDLRKVDGVRDVSRRFTALGYVEKKDGSPLPVVIHYLEPEAHPTVNDVQLRSGQFLTVGKATDALVDRSFADASELHVGDKLIVNPHSFAATFRVTGIALSAEYLIPTANPDMTIPDKGSLGVIYASRAQLDSIFADPLYNNLVFTYQPGADVRATTARVLGALNKLDVQRVVPKTSNFGYRYVDEILGGSRVFMPMTAILLAVMATIVAFISINRLVVSRRREIGSLLALGYSRGHFVLGFLVIGGVPGLVGALLGVPGACLFAVHLAKTNATIAGLPDPIMVYSWTSLLAAGAVSVLVGLFASLVPALTVLRLHPAHAIRGGDDARFTGLPGWLEPILGGSIGARYALRNVFRRLPLSLATAGLVALAVAMPAGLLTSLASWDTWVRTETDKAPWDAVATFKVPLKEELVQKIMTIPGLGDYETYVQGSATVERVGKEPQDMRVRGLPVPNLLIPLALTSGTQFSRSDAKEAIMNSAFSRGVGAPQLGETVRVVYHGEPHDLRVVGIIADASLSTMFVPVETAQTIFSLRGKASGAYLTFGATKRPRPPLVEVLPEAGPRPDFAETLEGVDDAPPPPPAVARRTDAVGMKNALLENEMVATVQTKHDIAGATLRYLAGFNAIVGPFVALGGFLAFFFLLSVLGFLLLERETEYATLRTMGYGLAEIARIVLIEVGAIAVVGLGLSFVTWGAISYLLRDLMATAWFEVPVSFRVQDYLVVSVPTACFLVLAALPGIRGLMRLDLAAVLRGRAMG